MMLKMACPQSTITMVEMATDSVESVKAQIALRSGMPAGYQQLIFAGKLLEDGDTLRDYDIQKGCVVHCVQRVDTGAQQSRRRRSKGKKKRREQERTFCPCF